MNSEEKVMGNSDLRRLIWSFLRKKPQRDCFYCGRVLIWDKEVHRHFSFPILDFTVIVYECIECSQKSNARDFSYMGGSLGYY